MSTPSPSGDDARRDAPRDSGSGAVNDLVAEILERIELDGMGAVDAVCAAHPEHAEALRRRVAHLKDVGLLEELPDAESGAMPERLGIYRLLRVLGGGGMGIVYLARDETLGRDVALKLIRPGFHHFPGSKERFRREVETVARLQHPGIVPVFAVGEDQGVPYFVMEHVNGCTLDAAIGLLQGRVPGDLAAVDLQRAIAARSADARPEALEPGYVFSGSYEEAALRIVKQVAEALEHAHRRGVLHRDVKPSNVIVAADGRAMLLDFGLAIAEENVRLTRSGTQLGSLGYMSPEQAEGATGRIGARSDVYSLGVTLYELLTLRLPYQAASAHQMIRAIGDGRPRAPRAANPSLSWEAETVCLTAMDADPARRYASAADLARDLGNVLDRRPIEARRAGFARRVAQWAARRPAEAAAAALAVALVVSVPTALLLKEREAKRRVEAEQGNTKAEAVRASRNFQLALDAVNAQLRELAVRELRFVPRMGEVRRRLVEKAQDLMRRLGADTSDDPALRRSMAETYAGVGSIQYDLGDLDASDASYAQAITLLEDLRVRDPGRVDDALALATAYRARCTLPRTRGRAEESIAWLERSESVLDKALALPGADAQAHLELALTLHSHGVALYFRDLAAAEPLLLRALEEHDRAGFSARPLDDPEAERVRNARQRHAATWSVLGNLRVDLGRVNAAVDAFDAGIALLESLVPPSDPAGVPRAAGAKETVDRPDVAFELGSLHINRGDAYRARDELERSDQDFGRAIELLRPIVRDYPALPEYRADLANALLNRGVVLQDLGRLDDAIPTSAEGASVLEALCGQFPENQLYAMACAKSWANVALGQILAGNPAAAVELGEKAVGMARRLAAADPGNDEFGVTLGGALHTLATAHQKSGEEARAKALTLEAIDVEQAILARTPGFVHAAKFLRNHYSKLSDLLIAEGDHAGGVAAGEKIHELAPDDGVQWRRSAWQIASAVPVAEGDTALGEEERAATAERYRLRAIELLNGAVDRGYKDREFIESQDVFAPLRGRDDYHAVLERMGVGN